MRERGRERERGMARVGRTKAEKHWALEMQRTSNLFARHPLTPTYAHLCPLTPTYAHLRNPLRSSLCFVRRSFFRLISHISETSIFLILGLSVVKTLKCAEAHFAFLFWTLLVCVVARAFNVYSLSGLYNLVHRGSSEVRIYQRGRSIIKRSEGDGISAQLQDVTFRMTEIFLTSTPTHTFRFRFAPRARLVCRRGFSGERRRWRGAG